MADPNIAKIVAFQEDAVETFVTDIKVAIKKLVDIGIDLPQDILAYLVLFKFPNLLQTLKHQIMHSDKELDVQFVFNHLIQFSNEAKVESRKRKGNNSQGNEQGKNSSTGLKRCKSSYHNPRQDRRSGGGSHKLRNFNTIKKGKKDATLPIRVRGNVKLKWVGRTIQLENCLFVPDSCELRVKNSTFRVTKTDHSVLKGRINNGLFTVDNPDYIGGKNQLLANVMTQNESLRETHKKFGHASIQRIEHFVDDSISRSERASFKCKSCVLAKITKQPFKEQSSTVSKPFKRLDLDLIGPINPESSLKNCYILTVVNNHTGYLAGFPLVHKDNTVDALINLLEFEHQRRGYYPTTICSDGVERKTVS
ncbi:hypothetical protein VP01_3485g1, partial [Puccinia sorghi]